MRVKTLWIPQDNKALFPNKVWKWRSKGSWPSTNPKRVQRDHRSLLAKVLELKRHNQRHFTRNWIVEKSDLSLSVSPELEGDRVGAWKRVSRWGTAELRWTQTPVRVPLWKAWSPLPYDILLGCVNITFIWMEGEKQTNKRSQRDSQIFYCEFVLWKENQKTEFMMTD